MTTKPFKIVLADDHAIFRESLKVLIEQEKIGMVIAEAENGQKLLEIMDQQRPDVVVMDIDMPRMNGLEATERIIAKYPDQNILILSMYGDQHHYNQLINAGVKGFVLKTSGKKELEKAIKTVAEGESHFSNELLRKIIVDIGNPKTKEDCRNTSFQLTERELEILKLFCNGLTVSEIANKLFLSVKTIEAYRSKLLSKTGAKNTINLILFAIKNKIVCV